MKRSLGIAGIVAASVSCAPAGAVVTWSSPPTGITVTTTGPSTNPAITITRTANGDGTLYINAGSSTDSIQSIEVTAYSNGYIPGDST